MQKYRTIYADPPWQEKGAGKIRRGADRHYPLMKTTDIMHLLVNGESIQSLAEQNCHLYLWSTNNFLEDALRVMDFWGFEYKTMITWAKDRIGLGQYFRGQTEHLLFGVCGNLPYKVLNGKRQQGTTLIVAPRQEHSKKPASARAMIERVSYAPRIELFARQKTEGWDIWGNEVQLKVEQCSLTVR